MATVGDIGGILDLAINAIERSEQGLNLALTTMRECEAILNGVAVGTGDPTLGEAGGRAMLINEHIEETFRWAQDLREAIIGYRGGL